MIIGLSLSRCIREILRGNVFVEDVAKIIAGTHAPTLDAFRRLVVEPYKKKYWQDDPVEAERIVMQLYRDGKIHQPRLKNNAHYPTLIRGIWVQSESQIHWNDSYSD